jgi:hypothetical protein
MRMAQYLGENVSGLLESAPFKRWPVERALDNDSDPPVIGYTFEGCGLEISCDLDERVRSIFLEAQEHDGFVLSEVPFGHNRDQVLKRFGSPSISGESVSHPVLGDFGPWDRFTGPHYTVHVQYRVSCEAIERITLMRNDVVPQ